MKDIKRKKVISVIKTVVAVIVLLGVGYLAVRYAPQLKQFLTARSTALKLEEWIDSFGLLGIPVLLLLQILQVFIAIIPSEPIEVAAGISYGGFWGFLVCLAGVGIGTVLVFKLVRRFGTPVVEKLVSKKKLKEFDFLKNTNRLEGITFILYFIPGLPKDVFTYFAALTQIPMRNFLLISLIARIPSVLVSTIAGNQYIAGNYKATLIIFLVFAALGVIGMIVYKLITKKLNQKQKVEEKNDLSTGKGCKKR